MTATDFNVKHIARLARLELSPEEERQYGAQLGTVLDYIETLKKADVAGVEPTAHPFPLTNVVRPDQVRPSLPNEMALKNAPSCANGLFIVPKIVE